MSSLSFSLPCLIPSLSLSRENAWSWHSNELFSSPLPFHPIYSITYFSSACIFLFLPKATFFPSCKNNEVSLRIEKAEPPEIDAKSKVFISSRYRYRFLTVEKMHFLCLEKRGDRVSSLSTRLCGYTLWIYIIYVQRYL